MSRRRSAAPGRATSIVVDVSADEVRVPLSRARVAELVAGVLRAAPFCNG